MVLNISQALHFWVTVEVFLFSFLFLVFHVMMHPMAKRLNSLPKGRMFRGRVVFGFEFLSD